MSDRDFEKEIAEIFIRAMMIAIEKDIDKTINSIKNKTFETDFTDGELLKLSEVGIKGCKAGEGLRQICADFENGVQSLHDGDEEC